MMEMSMDNKSSMHVALFPWLAMGHFIPFLRLSNKLAARGHRVSVLVPTKSQPKLLPHNHFPHLISFIPLQVPHVDGLPIGAETSFDVSRDLSPLVAVAFDLLKNQVQLVLQHLNPRPRFILHDFSHWLPPMARQLGIKSIFLAIGPATVYGFLLNHLDASVDQNDGNYKNNVTDMEEIILQPPSGFPLSSSFRLPRYLFRALFPNLNNNFGINIKFHDRVLTSLRESDAIAYATCQEVEGPFCDFIERQLKKPVLLTGPILPEGATPSASKLEARWDEWLDGFKQGSVVYCSLGSECKLEKNQFQELVVGLELTGLPFFVGALSFGDEKVEEALPEGFKDRVGRRGVVHGGWVQQQLILQHPSVGCFVSHCGSGSTWEGLVLSNCQMVLLPQFRDHHCNARLLSQVLKVGAEVERREEDGWFTRDALCKTVKLVMDEESPLGNELKANHAKWKAILSREGFESSYIDTFLANLEDLP